MSTWIFHILGYNIITRSTTERQSMKTYEEQKSFVAKLNVIDDVFFHKMAEDKEVCEEILRILLSKPNLKVIESQVQRYLRNIGAHSVILDVLCQDENGDYINVEVQKTDDDDHQRRLRFNQSNIDTTFVEKGIPYNKLPDIYLVFISKFDVFNEGHTVYHINRVIEETGTIVENGTHEIYANTAIDDKSDIAELMQYFKDSNGEHENFMKLCNRVKYFKESKEGVSEMCQLVEDYAKEYAKESKIENIILLFKNGGTTEMALKIFPNFSAEEIEKIKKESQSK